MVKIVYQYEPPSSELVAANSADSSGWATSSVLVFVCLRLCACAFRSVTTRGRPAPEKHHSGQYLCLASMVTLCRQALHD